jgi:hypothetical protein
MRAWLRTPSVVANSNPDGILATRDAQIIAPPPTLPRGPDAQADGIEHRAGGAIMGQNARLLTPAVWLRLSERAAWRQAIFAPPVSDCRLHLAVTLRWSSLAIGESGMGGNVLSRDTGLWYAWHPW